MKSLHTAIANIAEVYYMYYGVLISINQQIFFSNREEAIYNTYSGLNINVLNTLLTTDGRKPIQCFITEFYIFLPVVLSSRN